MNAMNPAARSTIKRLTDVMTAAVALVLLGPLLSMIALAVYFSLGRPVIFRQVRVGYRGRPFTIYKFRTMRETRRADGEPLPDPDRVTALGRWLRKTSLDELPQLWNVLRGDVSFVGPRPQLARHLASCTPEQGRRHEVRPGLTGWAQVNGRNEIGWDDRFRYDVWYVDHWSPLLDARIILLTIAQVIRCQGVSEEGVEMPTSVRDAGMATRGAARP